MDDKDKEWYGQPVSIRKYLTQFIAKEKAKENRQYGKKIKKINTLYEQKFYDKLEIMGLK